MLPALSSRSARSVGALSLQSRRLATHVPSLTAAGSPPGDASSSSTVTAKEGALRPHLGIQVNPNHGLYAFFRRKEKEGNVRYETVEPSDVVSDKSGTSHPYMSPNVALSRCVTSL